MAGSHGRDEPGKRGRGDNSQAFAENIERNSVHGSDAAETAAAEIPFFFSTAELL